MRQSYPDISGVILAGGRSSRLGQDKPFLRLKGRRLIDITLEVFKSMFTEIFIVTDKQRRFAGFKDVQVVEDLVRGCGPLGAIYTGLKAISREKAFFVACDMPFLHIGLISRLVDLARAGNFDCVVPCSDKGIEPLQAVYARGMLTALRDSLDRKELSIKQFLRHCPCKYIQAHREELTSFFNLNTWQDLKEMEAYANKIENLAGKEGKACIW